MKIFMKKCGRTDMERHYKWTAYNNAVAEAKQHMSVSGVRERIANAEKDADNYRLELTNFLERERLQENEKYNSYEKSVKQYNTIQYVFVG